MNFLIVLSFVAALLALVAGALAIVGVKGVRGPASKVDGLVADTAALEARVSALEKQLADAKPKEAKPAPAPKKDAKPWDDFLADYNLLAASIDTPQTSQEACDRFFALQNLKGLICLDPAAQVDGKAAPKFVEVAQAEKSAYWAYAFDEGKMFAIVPNPVKGYTKNLHEKGGMKETFASDFDDKDVPRVQVKLPALFTHENGTWVIAQPGIVKLLDE